MIDTNVHNLLYCSSYVAAKLFPMQQSLNADHLASETEELIIKLIEKHSRPASEIILDDVDLRNLLKISRRTALEYRKKGVFKFYKLENKIFYFLADVLSGIKEKGVGRGN